MNVTTLVDLASDSEQLSNLVQYLDKLKQTPKEDSLYQKIQSNLSDTSKHGEILQLILAEADTFFQKGNEKGYNIF
jgi:F0F1-type ATP synthase delta subunit